jgi:hypothetical protein
MIDTVHLVVYSNGEPFNTTKRLLIESISKHTKYKVMIHDYDLNKIKTYTWFKLLRNLLKINKLGRRDGYYNSWKAFIVCDVYNKMNSNDILYYVDSSQYHIEGFTHNIDKICEYTYKTGIVAGSVSDDTTNYYFNVCDNLLVWDKIIPNKINKKHLNIYNNYLMLFFYQTVLLLCSIILFMFNINLIKNKYLSKKHVLNSWFILRKDDINTNFIKEWMYYTICDDKLLYSNEQRPLVTFHHTVDQSIFNILVNKYNLPVFYDKNIKHSENKNKNLALEIINNSSDINKHFIIL